MKTGLVPKLFSPASFATILSLATVLAGGAADSAVTARNASAKGTDRSEAPAVPAVNQYE